MMKKNKFMRLASVLLVLTLLSTCAISGTFAKYVTTATASDTARVAKWGVVLTVPQESSFNTSYTDTQNGITVTSSDTSKVVAPGTSGTAITFSISGKPEVACKIDIAMEVKSDIFLKTNDGTAYYPVKFTLKQTAGVYKSVGEDNQVSYGTATTEAPYTVVNGGTLADIKKAVEAASMEKVDPNKDLASTYVLTWEWAFDDATNSGSNDAKDTILGNLAADTNYYGTGDSATYKAVTTMPTAGQEAQNTYSTNLEYSITFTVTQVD